MSLKDKIGCKLIRMANKRFLAYSNAFMWMYKNEWPKWTLIVMLFMEIVCNKHCTILERLFIEKRAG